MQQPLHVFALQTQLPPEQMVPGPHTLPHAPQLFGSEAVVAQTSGVAPPLDAHSVSPEGQVQLGAGEDVQLLPGATCVEQIVVSVKVPLGWQVSTFPVAALHAVVPGTQVTQPRLSTHTSPSAVQLLFVVTPVALHETAVVPLHVIGLPITQPQKPPPVVGSQASPTAHV
jgi:hypothetical protein